MSESLLDAMSARVAAAFSDAGADPALGRVVRSAKAEGAPFQCNGAMAAAKAAGGNPRALAESIAAKLLDDPLFEAVEAAGPGFLNLTPTSRLYTARAAALASDPRSGARLKPSSERVMIDFGGPNVAKPMHVGHLRSAVIGDTLQRLMRFRGDDVISDIHLGDWGLQMGHLITELADEQPALVYFDPDFDGPYPSAPPVTLEDLARLYPQASANAKADAERLRRSRRATAELQDGRAGYRALVRHFIAVSVAGLRADYAALNVSFDLWKGESDADPLVPSVVELMNQSGAAEKSDGALIVRVTRPDDKKELAPLILISSEGSALYATTDLATILDRVRDWAPDRILYVVDLGQSDHFEQVFRAADRAGLMPLDRLEHIKFGTVNGADGKRLRTREGGAFRLADLVASAQTRARERLAEAGLGAELDGAERERVAGLIATAALRFSDLQNQRLTNYVFDLDRFTSFEGKTGPYLVYQAVRIKSLLRKAAAEHIRTGPISATAPEERALVIELDSFGAALEAADNKRAPHILCEHAYALAGSYSKFYAACPVLAATDPSTRASRLALSGLVLHQLSLVLDLLGIETPERM